MSRDLARLLRPREKFGIVFRSRDRMALDLGRYAQLVLDAAHAAPPLDRHATRSPIFNPLAMPPSEKSSHPNAPDAIRLQEAR